MTSSLTPRCDKCGEPAEYAVYTIRMTRKGVTFGSCRRCYRHIKKWVLDKAQREGPPTRVETASLLPF